MKPSTWLIAGLALALLQVPQVSAAKTRPEPAHAALIIGNWHYAPKDGSQTSGPDALTFPDLPNACNDAQAIAASLVANADWAEGDITRKCDLTAGQMLTEIRHFANKLRSKPGSVGVIYFAGHGVQVADHNYLFGIGANPDARVEATQFISNPDAPLFVDDAIDLHDDITREVGNVTNGALVVIIDACRQNPLLAKVAAALNQLGRAPGSIVVSAPSRQTKTVPGIVIAYSTSDGETAPDGLGANSPYAEAFGSHIISGKQIMNILNETTTAVYKDSRSRFPAAPQNPTATGSFAEPPTWCLSKCPDEEGQNVAALDHPQHPPGSSTTLWRLAAFRPDDAAGLPPEAPAAHPPSTVQLHNEQVPPDEILLDRKNAKPAKGIASFNVDVYWCMGGPEESARHDGALKVSRDLAQKGAAAAFGPGLALNRVRARPLSIQANSTSDYRFETNVTAIGDSQLAADLATEAGKVLGNLHAASSQSSVPGLLNIYVCKRSTVDRSGSVYVQYPLAANGKALAISAVKTVAHDNPELNLIDGVHGIEGKALGKSPKRTEVRFYSFQDQLGAFDAARSLEILLGHKVLVKYMPRLVDPTSRHPIEIWIGEDDPMLTSASNLALEARAKPSLALNSGF